MLAAYRKPPQLGAIFVPVVVSGSVPLRPTGQPLPNRRRLQKCALAGLGVAPFVVPLPVALAQLQPLYYARLYPPRKPVKPPGRHQVPLLWVGVLLPLVWLTVLRLGQLFTAARRCVRQVNTTRLVPLAAVVGLLQQNVRNAQLPLVPTVLLVGAVRVLRGQK